MEDFFRRIHCAVWQRAIRLHEEADHFVLPTVYRFRNE
jgi:hypothetical protein